MLWRRKASSGAGSAATPPVKLNVDGAAVDKAFEALKTYDFGASRAALMPIDDAVVACLGDTRSRRELEKRLTAAMKADISPLAKEYVCRQLCLIGSAESAPALAELLADPKLSHWARSALEHVPGSKAARALRRSLPTLRGLEKIGVVNALGMRRDADSASALASLLEDPDTRIVGAAAAALGNIGTSASAKVLLKFQPAAPDAVRSVLADACLSCAERLAAAGKKTVAAAIYKALAGSPQPEHVRAAATRGLSLAVGKR